MLDIVELLARSSGLRYTDVVRELGLTQATAHAILTTLCRRGWAVRDPVDKSFAIGPALAVVAAHTEAARPLARAARVAALRVAEETGFPSSVVERVGESLVITAFEDATGRPAGTPGDRIRYAPPFGVAFAAWDTKEEQRAWMRRGGVSDPELTRRLVLVLARTRARGFDVDCTTPALTQAAHLVSTLPSDGLPDHVRQITDRLLVEFATIGVLADDDRRDQPVATIAAPVFDPRGGVAMIVAVHPLQALSAEEIDSVGRCVAGVTGEIARG